MQFSSRTVLGALAIVCITSAFTSCGKDKDSGGEDPPTTVDDILEVTSVGATSVAVLSNDTDLDNTPLSYSIEVSPTVGDASFNDDGTVRLDLPSGFRGVTRFRYKVTNSLGGFSISTAVVFVDVPRYRVAFAAQSSTQSPEIYITDFTSPQKVSQATSGNLRLQNMWLSKTGSTLIYERADPANATTTNELYYVDTSPIASPVRITPPLNRAIVAATNIAISDDGRYAAFATSPTLAGGQATNLHVFDTTSSKSAVGVGQSANLLAGLTTWVEGVNTVYFMSTPGTSGPAVYRASIGNLDSPQRVSPIYPASDTNVQLLISPDQTRMVLIGIHSAQLGAFFVNPDSPNTERRLTTDIPAGAALESFQINDAFTEITYLWRSLGASTARLSVAPIASTGNPRTVLNADITNFSSLNPDDTAALITRGSGGSGADGTLFEVPLDASSTGTRITTNVSGGLYDDIGDRVYLFSKTLAPAVIARSDFDDNPTALVRTNTAAQTLFIRPFEVKHAAIINDSTSGLVLVNAASPGDTYRLTSMDAVTGVPGLVPAAITAAP